MARSTRAEWAKRVERWQDSGLSAKEFATELDVSPGSLTFWKWKLRQVGRGAPRNVAAQKLERPKRAETPTKFLQLVPTSPSSPPMVPLELVLTNGIVLRVPKDFDEPTLARLVRLLGTR